MKFTYGSGQRPLEGYTIKRGVGRGGFGEVYFAVSDGGKEVALKLIRGESATELRGIAQCLNLKHPNLVNLYDLRTDEHGDYWVVMEYIAGEPLHLVLNRHPRGVPAELATQWFLALARAVAYLHDHGIVHRDLKPANLFLENGLLKIGDYGLSKFISASQRTAQTQSVGTVHYMAPEVGGGHYTKQVDVYACGVLLYEMLTGRVPFEGETTGEVLMKHLTTPPDLSKLPTRFAPVVAKALAKNPAHRYTTMTEFAQAVERLDRAEVLDAEPAEPRSTPRRASAPPPRSAARRFEPEPPLLNALPALSRRERVGELAGAMAMSSVLAVATTALVAAIGRVEDWAWIGAVFFQTVAVCWAVLIPAKFWPTRPPDSWQRRLVMMSLGLGVGSLAFWLSGWVPRDPLTVGGSSWEATSTAHPPGALRVGREGLMAAAGYVSYFGLALGALRWWRVADRRRPQWFSLFPVLAAGFWAMALLFVWPWHESPSPTGAAALILASVLVQWVSPWEPPPPTAPRRLRLRYA